MVPCIENPLQSNLFQFFLVINYVSITHSLLVLKSPHFAAGPIGCASQMSQTLLFSGILLTLVKLTGWFATPKLKLKLFPSSIPTLYFLPLLKLAESSHQQRSCLSRLSPLIAVYPISMRDILRIQLFSKLTLIILLSLPESSDLLLLYL